MKKKTKKTIKVVLVVSAVLASILLIGYFGVLNSISSECGSYSGEGTVYYYGNVNGNYLTSSGQPSSIEDRRFTSQNLEDVVSDVDSFVQNYNWNPSFGVEWAKCTVGSYTPSRCGNPYASCSAVPSGEIKAIQEVIDSERVIKVYRFENNDCGFLSIKAIEKTENDYDTLAECDSKIIIIEEVEPEVIEIIEDVAVECSSNVECQSSCGTDIPTCENNACFCSGQQIFEEEGVSFYFYLIPLTVIGLVALIVWQRRKKGRRKK